MIIAPLVFTTLVVGVAHMGDTKYVGRIGAKAMLGQRLARPAAARPDHGQHSAAGLTGETLDLSMSPQLEEIFRVDLIITIEAPGATANA